MILKAAVKVNGEVYTVEPPGRHNDIKGIPTETSWIDRHMGEGFIDDKEGFVDRERARVIAEECGQIFGITQDRDKLTTLDLW